MTLFDPNPSRSNIAPIAGKGQLPLRIATALLMTVAAALVLIEASAWAGAPSADFGLLAYVY